MKIIRKRNRVSVVKNIMNLVNRKINMTLMNGRPLQLFQAIIQRLTPIT